MKGTSKVIMGATLVMVVTLAIVLGLILVLLADLYCSLLLRRRRQHKTESTNSIVNTDLSSTTVSATEAATASAEPSSQPSAEPPSQPQGPPLGSFLGVLRAPRSFLFPSYKEEYNAEPKKQQQCHLQHVLDIPNQELSKEPPLISLANSPQPKQKDPVQAGGTTSNTVAAAKEVHLVYISNPIYDNEANRASSSTTGANTPFETPDTSPSRLETGGSSSSGEDNDEVAQPTPSVSGPSSPTTRPLTPMKKLPKEACSVSLRDARSLGTSGSDSNSNNGNSSSSSGTPCTSPSW